MSILIWYQVLLDRDLLFYLITIKFLFVFLDFLDRYYITHIPSINRCDWISGPRNLSDHLRINQYLLSWLLLTRPRSLGRGIHHQGYSKTLFILTFVIQFFFLILIVVWVIRVVEITNVGVLEKFHDLVWQVRVNISVGELSI